MSDDGESAWLWWQNALDGDVGQITTTPEQGFYRMREYQGRDQKTGRSKLGRWLPVAIWYDAAKQQWRCQIDGQNAHADETWTFCCRNPVSHEDYERVRGGGEWADEPREAAKPEPALPAIGHNQPTDPHDAMREEFVAEREIALEILKAGIKTKDDADRLSIVKDRVLKIRTRADEARATEKQPHLDAGAAVDNRWRDLAHKTDGETSKLVEDARRALDAFLKEQRRIEDERQRKAKAEADAIAAEAERQRQAAAMAEREAARTGDGTASRFAAEAAAEADRLSHAAAAAERAAEPQKVDAGRTGAKTVLVKTTSAIITDFDKLLMALKDSPDVRELVQKLADRAAKAGVTLEGMKIHTEEKAR